MQTWSTTSLKCDWCSVRYDLKRNVVYKRRDFCSFKCREDYIDVMAHVNGTGDDNPSRDLRDWRLSATAIDP